jgi:hypothetical protein
MKLTLTFLTVALLLCVVMVSQQRQQITVNLQVPKAGSLGLLNAAPAGLRQVSVHARGGESSTIQLLVRSNSAYRIRLDGAAVRVGQISVTPNAGGARLMAGAMNVRTSSELPNIVEGPRISNGGNNGTPDNALLINVPIELPEGAAETDLNFRLEFLPD